MAVARLSGLAGPCCSRRLWPRRALPGLRHRPPHPAPQGSQPGAPGKLERLIGHFWDIGLEIGHSVRTIQECLDQAAGDITVQTALLEARLLSGNARLFATFEKRLRGNLDPLIFFEAKRLEQQERYLRFNETPSASNPTARNHPAACATCR